MSTIVTLSLIFVSYKIIKLALKNEGAAKVAKIEARLKLDLAERIEDPELIRKIVEARLPLEDHEDLEESRRGNGRFEAEVSLETGAKAREPGPRTGLPSDMHGYVLWGLILFLVGTVVVVASYADAAGFGDLAFPGLITGAVGIALLSFATSQKHLRKQLGIDEERA